MKRKKIRERAEEALAFVGFENYAEKVKKFGIRSAEIGGNRQSAGNRTGIAIVG